MRLITFFLLTALLKAQTPVTIRANAAEKIAPFRPIYGYFGYDEPNYTYAENGQKLIRELTKLSDTKVHIRTHFLLTTGDGTPGLKWGSTNAYTEDANGRPVYDWTIVDKILGTFVQAGAIPFVEIGFMPKALSNHPEPYTPTWIPGGKNDQYDIGWTYPPNDYGKWGELVYQWVKHSIDKYGRSAVETWDWEVWNEPNIDYWHGTPEEYDKLYDYAAAAVKRALPSARVGGPASTGPDNAKAAAFLRQFLEHCSSGRNFVTGQTGSPLDFITYHAKGRPKLVEGHVRMGLAQELKDTSKGFEIVRAFPQFQKLPIVLSEADPEGCAACSARVYPQNAYRNGTLYPSYEAVALKSFIELNASGRMNLQGMLTWAFEFENQPYFDGFRTLATNGVDKPVLNFFRMAGMMHGDLVKVESTIAVAVDSVLSSGVTVTPDIDALATRADHSIAVMIWNYSDDDVPGPVADVKLEVAGIPAGARRISMRHYRIDESHSNAYSVWKAMGSPQDPGPEQYKKLEASGKLQLLEPPHSLVNKGSAQTINFSLPRQGISLVELMW